jgi:hypothetical protein
MQSQGEFCVMVCTHRQQIGDDAMANLERIGAPARRVEGSGAPSCSAVWNRAVIDCPAETVIICNEKARPEREHIDRTLSLLAEGHALVGLYRFGFFGFHKDLIRCIGWFDERYLGGWYEDCDCIYRLCEADVSYWEEESVPYIQMPSSWHHDDAHAHWKAKWVWSDGWIRLLGEEPQPEYDAAIGSRGLWTVNPGRFLPWDAGHKLPNSAAGVTVLR